MTEGCFWPALEHAAATVRDLAQSLFLPVERISWNAFRIVLEKILDSKHNVRERAWDGRDVCRRTHSQRS
eukprot:2270740-Rhodomonas_salina.1